MEDTTSSPLKQGKFGRKIREDSESRMTYMAQRQTVEEEAQRARERAFDAGLIGRGHCTGS